jgi:MFS transporter, PPP family, 3-phenylpropionic acid transporter
MLKLFYLCFFISSGVSIPFFPAYLRQIGLSGQQVSLLLAIAPALQLGVPLLWGWIADRSRRPDLVLRGLCLGALLSSLPVIFARNMPALFVSYLAQQFFAVPIMSLADSLAVEKSRRRGHYGTIRATGSASFIAACLLVGWWLDLRAIPRGDSLVPILICFGYGLSFLASFKLTGHPDEQRPHLRDVRALLADRRFLLLLPVGGLHWAAMVPYHGFLGILLHDRGFPAKITSYAFFVGVTAEIAIFLLSTRLRARLGLTRMLGVAFALSAARWWLVAALHSAPWMVVLQLTHAFSFGLYWIAAMAWIAECVPSKLRATGQVLFTTATGLGSMLGYLIVGRIYDASGGAGLPFALAGVLELVPLALVMHSGRRAGATVTASVPATK